MQNHKILILDNDIDAAGILKEHINTLGYFNVYLSTNWEIMDDLFRNNHFNFIFMDIETISAYPGKDLKFALLGEAGICLVLIHWEFDDAVHSLMRRLPAKHFLKKPYDLKMLATLLRAS